MVSRANDIEVLRVQKILVAAFWCACPSHAFAQNDTNLITDDQLPTLSIEANAETVVGEVEHQDFAGRYTRIEGDTLKRTDTGLADVLAFESGVQLQRVGGFGSFSSISVRASSPSQTNIFLDGIRLNGAANAVIDLSAFDLRSLNSVDVYRGAAPLLLGSTNLGGAVNLTSAATGDDFTQVKFTAGSFGTLQSNLSHRQSGQQWHSVTTVDVGRSDNSFELLNNNTTPLNPNDDVREPRNNADVRSFGILSKAGFSHSEQASSDLLFQHTQRTTGVPEFRNNENNVASYEEGRGQLLLSHRNNNFDGWARRHTAFIQWADDHYDDRLSQVGLGAQNFRSQQRVFGASTYWDQFSLGGKWAFTAEARREGFDSEDPFGRDRDINATRNSLSAGLAYTRFAFNDNVIVTPRLRLESHRSDRQGNNLASESMDSGFVFNPELSARWQQTTRLAWTASLGRYFRIPTFSEMFGTQGLVIGNEDLNPEQGINTEISVQWAATKLLNVSATLFHSGRDDTIVTVFDARGIGRNANTGSATIQGFEFETSWSPTSAMKLKTNLTVQDTNNQSNIIAFSGKQLPNQSALSAYVRGEYQAQRYLTLWSELNLAQERFYDLGNFLPAEDATVINVGTQWQRNQWSADFTVSNITDQTIEDFNGFPRPGRSFSLGFSYQL